MSGVGPGWPTVRISIDFVDFLAAKFLVTTVEEWFGRLEQIASALWTKKYTKTCT